MAEYIDKASALRPFVIDKNGHFIRETDIDNRLVDISIRQVKQILREIPAADVAPVVRCKDCKWFGRDLGYGKHDCKKYEMPYCLETDFCSYGERRESE